MVAPALAGVQRCFKLLIRSRNLKGRQIPFTNHVKYIGAIFDKIITWKIYTETIGTKALRIFLSIYPILKSERLSVHAKLIMYKALISSILTYACPAWEFAADSYLSKLQQLQNKVLRTTGNSQGTLRLAIYMDHLKFHIYMISLHNYAGSKLSLYAIMTML